MHRACLGSFRFEPEIQSLLQHTRLCRGGGVVGTGFAAGSLETSFLWKASQGREERKPSLGNHLVRKHKANAPKIIIAFFTFLKHLTVLQGSIFTPDNNRLKFSCSLIVCKGELSYTTKGTCLTSDLTLQSRGRPYRFGFLNSLEFIPEKLIWISSLAVKKLTYFRLKLSPFIELQLWKELLLGNGHLNQKILPDKLVL